MKKFLQLAKKILAYLYICFFGSPFVHSAGGIEGQFSEEDFAMHIIEIHTEERFIL